MSKNLMIVESPAKAKTIEKILGKDFLVKSCYGHIRDLPKDDTAIDKENNYSPKYVIPADKKQVVKELKKLSKDAEEVWLATDEDREGEAISWHLANVLDLDVESVKRIVFHEITKNAILNAVDSPRKLNMDLVSAQQARRVLDRLVGFELSPILWKKVKSSLSAGRVQSVAVRLIVEKERDIDSFEVKSSFKVTALFDVSKDGINATLKAELPDRFPTKADAEAFLNKCIGAAFTIGDIQVKPAKKSPAAPFTTSTLQQEASRKLSFSVARTMSVAQRLYEAGKITYMRTDSVNLSDSAISACEAQIKSQFGPEYSNPKKYVTKSSGAQEAHEAIRPTEMNQESVEGSVEEQKLYQLIWKRTLASQMSQAQIEKTTARINISTTPETLVAQGEVVKFDGFLKVYIESRDEDPEDDQSTMLPPLSIGQTLQLLQMDATERFSRPPARYTEASLVKKLEELGIGRPSTYAPTISTIQKRGYVVRENREGHERAYIMLELKDGQISTQNKTEITGTEKAKLFPTDIGKLVNDFLIQHFQRVMDYNFTAQIEKEFDEIAAGQKEWNAMIDVFYKPFHEDVETTLEKAERVTGERALGTDPESGKPVIARMGRYGPMAQIGKAEDDEKPRYAKLRPQQTLETISLEEALELFKLPRKLGEFEGSEVVASEGRFGPYVQHNKKFYGLKNTDLDPFTISIDQASELIRERRVADAQKVIREYEENNIKILRGPYGPYIKVGNRNVKIPKDRDPETLSLEECLEIIDKAPVGKKGRARKAK